MEGKDLYPFNLLAPQRTRFWRTRPTWPICSWQLRTVGVLVISMKQPGFPIFRTTTLWNIIPDIGVSCPSTRSIDLSMSWSTITIHSFTLWRVMVVCVNGTSLATFHRCLKDPRCTTCCLVTKGLVNDVLCESHVLVWWLGCWKCHRWKATLSSRLTRWVAKRCTLASWVHRGFGRPLSWKRCSTRSWPWRAWSAPARVSSCSVGCRRRVAFLARYGTQCPTSTAEFPRNRRSTWMHRTGLAFFSSLWMISLWQPMA